MMMLYVKGDADTAYNAAHFRGLNPIGGRAYPRLDWDMHVVYVKPAPSDVTRVYDWHGEGPGKGPYPPGTLLWFKHCE